MTNWLTVPSENSTCKHDELGESVDVLVVDHSTLSLGTIGIRVAICQKRSFPAQKPTSEIRHHYRATIFTCTCTSAYLRSAVEHVLDDGAVGVDDA